MSTFNLVVTKKNEATLQISCDAAVAQELSDYFCFSVPGHQFQPKFKAGVWDGKIRLFDRRFYTLPSGLTGYLQKFAEERGYTCVFDDAVLLTANFSIVEARDFAQSLHLPHVPHDYQIEAFAKSIRTRRALVVSPTASGKSLIIYMITRFLQQNHRKGLIIVPTTTLVEQLFTDFKEYGWDVDTHVHRQYSGKEKSTRLFLTISTWQTLAKQSPEYLAQFDFVIGDEAHQYKAKVVSLIMNDLVNADVRIGTTGTLDGTKTHKLVLEGHFGPKFQVVTTRQLMDEGKVAELKIKCLILKYPESLCHTLKKATYDEEYEAVIQNQARMSFIRNLALSLTGNTLILFQLIVRHGKPLFEEIQAHANGRQVFFIHKDVKTEERERIRHLVESSSNTITCATYGTMSTGTNIKRLDNVIFAGPSKARIRNLQSIGRGLRLAEGKTHATLFDIVDDLRIGKRENFLLRHFRERAIIYNSEKFPFKQYHIEL